MLNATCFRQGVAQHSAAQQPLPLGFVGGVGPRVPSSGFALYTAPASSSAALPVTVLPAGSRRLVAAQGHISAQVSLPVHLDLDTPLPGFDSIESALADLAAGKFVVVLDDENRENEGDLIINADKVTTESMAFLVEHSSGVVCISMEAQDMERLRLPLMVSSAENEEAMYTAFTVTVDLKEGISTGISASDRAKTIRRMADPSSTAAEFRKPGHIFPLRYRPGGVLVRPGHTEAAVDLARLSGSHPAGVLCEIVDKADGSMARTPKLLKFAKEHGLKCITIADLIRYRMRHEGIVAHKGSAQVQSQYGQVTVHSFRSIMDDTEHLAFVFGEGHLHAQDALVHVHHERTVADLLGATEPCVSRSLHDALQAVLQAGSGVVVYLRGQTSRGLQPSEELQGIATGTHTLYTTDLRDTGAVAQMLSTLGLQSVKLASSDADLMQGLRSCGMRVVLAGQASTNGNGHHKPLQSALSGVMA